MSRIVYRIATDARSHGADDMSGAGAKKDGGRWNEQDVAVVYASQTRSLACLETFVHLNSGGLPLNRYLVEIDIPDTVWSAREEVDEGTLVGWNAEPASITSIGFGTRWIAGNRSAMLVVPSAIVLEERNILINPAHPDSAAITARKVRRWTYDPRMTKVA